MFKHVMGYTFITAKTTVFLYTSNEQSEKEAKKTVLLTRASKIVKTVINLTKELKDLHTENYKTPLKEIKNLIYGKASLIHGMK